MSCLADPFPSTRPGPRDLVEHSSASPTPGPALSVQMHPEIRLSCLRANTWQGAICHGTNGLPSHQAVDFAAASGRRAHLPETGDKHGAHRTGRHADWLAEAYGANKPLHRAGWPFLQQDNAAVRGLPCVSRRRHCRSCLSFRLPPRLPRSAEARRGSAGSLMTGLPTVGGSCKGLLLAIARRTALADDLLNRAPCLRNAFMTAPKTRKAQTLLLRSSDNVASSDTFRDCAAAATYATAAPGECSSA